jgi:hypothetical protein
VNQEDAFNEKAEVDNLVQVYCNMITFNQRKTCSTVFLKVKSKIKFNKFYSYFLKQYF